MAAAGSGATEPAFNRCRNGEGSIGRRGDLGGGRRGGFRFLEMAFTYIYGTPIFYVRLLIPDTNQASPIFQDDEIQGFMDINSMTWQSSMFYSYQAGSPSLPQSPSNFLRAAALALNTLAGNSSRLAAVTGLLDVKLAPAAAAKALQDAAQRYLDMDDNSGAFVILEQCTTSWGFRDRWWSQLQRQTGGA
jgi:hypothetical protein